MLDYDLSGTASLYDGEIKQQITCEPVSLVSKAASVTAVSIASVAVSSVIATNTTSCSEIASSTMTLFKTSKDVMTF